jgi:dTDP-4-amino-4,6-dideoxygalactose transaminase
VTTDDDELAARVRVLRDHGASTRYHHDVVGGNFRLDALQAAVLRVKLSRLGEWTARRRANADRYGELFAKTNSAAVVSLPTAPSGWMHVFHQYAIRARDRDGLRSHLASKSIGTGVYYPVPLHRQPCFDASSPRPPACPHADRAAEAMLALPVYPELTAEQQQFVVDAVAEYRV